MTTDVYFGRKVPTTGAATVLEVLSDAAEEQSTASPLED
jgi:hypothetical protein